MQLTCPMCHGKFSLESALESDAAGELLVLLSQAGPVARPLVAYLGLFRSKSRALSFERARRLACEVMDMGIEPSVLIVALGKTVESLRQKRDAGYVRPLKDHRYLASVIESTKAETSATGLSASPASMDAAPRGKRAQAIAALQQWAGDCWVRREIAHGLQALVALSRPGTPAADTITLTADVWEVAIRGNHRMELEEIDGPRLHKAFKGLIKQPLKDWPDPAALAPHMPTRPDLDRLPPAPRSDEETERGLSAARKIMEVLQ